MRLACINNKRLPSAFLHVRQPSEAIMKVLHKFATLFILVQLLCVTSDGKCHKSNVTFAIWKNLCWARKILRLCRKMCWKMFENLWCEDFRLSSASEDSISQSRVFLVNPCKHKAEEKRGLEENKSKLTINNNNRMIIPQLSVESVLSDGGGWIDKNLSKRSENF